VHFRHPDIYIGQDCIELIEAAPNYNFSTIDSFAARYSLRAIFFTRYFRTVRGKLLFALCRNCCETFSQAACTHDDPTDCEFEGTWISCELCKAIEKGYLVTNVSKIWPYKVARYDPGTRQSDLFAEYINILQLKQEASGWPSECENDDDAKERYLREYEKTEGIVLDRNNISQNSGLCSVANFASSLFGENLANELICLRPRS